MTGYQKSPDYGGPDPNLPKYLLGAAIIAAIIAVLAFSDF